MSINELKKHIEKLRYVKVGDEVRTSDYNIKVNCVKLIRDNLLKLNPENPSIRELEKILEKLEYARTGDTIPPEHHNLIVDALKVISSILEYLLKPRLQPALGLTVAYDTSTILGVPEPLSIPEAAPLYGVNLVALELTATSIFMEVSVYYLTTYK